MSCATNAYSLGAIAPTSVRSRVKLETLANAIALMINIIREAGERRRAAHLIQPDDGQ